MCLLVVDYDDDGDIIYVCLWQEWVGCFVFVGIVMLFIFFICSLEYDLEELVLGVCFVSEVIVLENFDWEEFLLVCVDVFV